MAARWFSLVLLQRTTPARSLRGFSDAALVTFKTNLFIHFVALCSRPLNVLSGIQLERRSRNKDTNDGLTAPPGGPRQNDNVLKHVMLNLLLLINNVDDSVNKGYCGILPELILASVGSYFEVVSKIRVKSSRVILTLVLQGLQRFLRWSPVEGSRIG